MCNFMQTIFLYQSDLYLPGGPGHSELNAPPHWKIFTIFPLTIVNRSLDK